MATPIAGTIAQLPLPTIFHELARTSFTGRLTLVAPAFPHEVWWREGRIVDASSPAPEDQPIRVLARAGLVADAQVAGALDRLLDRPDENPLAVLVAMGALPDAAVTYAARLIVEQRAARVFSVDSASTTVEPFAHDRFFGGPLAAHRVLYRGLGWFYDERRLDRELMALGGAAIQAGGDSEALLERFGFGDEERICLAYLRKGYWEPCDLVDACVSLPRRTVLCVLLALHVTGELDVQPANTVPRLRKRAREHTDVLVRQRLQTPPGTPIAKLTEVVGPDAEDDVTARDKAGALPRREPR